MDDRLIRGASQKMSLSAKPFINSRLLKPEAITVIAACCTTLWLMVVSHRPSLRGCRSCTRAVRRLFYNSVLRLVWRIGTYLGLLDLKSINNCKGRQYRFVSFGCKWEASWIFRQHWQVMGGLWIQRYGSWRRSVCCDHRSLSLIHI